MLSQQELDISKAEAEHVVQPDGMADDLGGKAMRQCGSGGRFMPTVSLVSNRPARPGYRDNAIEGARQKPVPFGAASWCMPCQQGDDSSQGDTNHAGGRRA